MPTVIPVKFRFAAHDLWFDPADSGAELGDHVICSTERGTEIGLATADPSEVSLELLKQVTSSSTLKPVLRVADDEDLDRASDLADKGDDAMPTFRRLVEESGLDMKPVGVEYLFDSDKVVCYFAAEERVDFRQLVRDLSRDLHERIDMRQIGVREEAALVGGYAHCGQELCCSRFGHEFEPVSIRMAKEQDLPLNSTKISGSCGRLMCCLRYEFEAYRDFKGRAPKKNAVIDTPLGKAKIWEYDTPKEQLALRLENGKMIRVPLAGMVASEAAQKKSADLGCPCRPDTVTRDVLESLQSADVQMALNDLDRANGVVPAETFDAADIFVDTEKRSGRRRSRGGNAGSGNGSGSGENAGRGASGSASGAQQPGEGRGRSRRRRGSGSGSGQPVTGETASPTKVAGAEGTTRRRRHHSSAEGAQQGAQAPAQTSQGGEGKPKVRRRRPGDKGGAAQGGQGSSDAKPQSQGQGQPQGANPQASSDGGQKPRKRRHRGGRGRGKGAGEGGAASGEGAAPSGE